jgi:hypothetical protein
MGALCSLLVHELANQMCIIAGNATFAQLAMQDRERLATAVDAIAKASERASQVLERCGDLRHQLASDLPHGDVQEVRAWLESALRRLDGWSWDAEGVRSGALSIPSIWVGFVIQQSMQEILATRGKIRLQGIAAAHTGIEFPTAETYLEILLTYVGGKPFSIQAARESYENYGLLAAFELIRNAGGQVEGQDSGGGETAVRILIPMLGPQLGAAKPTP